MSGGPFTSVPEGGNFQWSRQNTAWVIDMYRQKPCLWNIKSADYKDRNKRVVAHLQACRGVRDI